MGYLHIDNLYKNQEILLFRECYALEKVHGTSAHIGYRADEEPHVRFFAGGESHERFVSLFDAAQLEEKFRELGHQRIIVYGEAYGGKQQGMRKTYGESLKFIVFDLQIGEMWVDVPTMAQIAQHLGLEEVPFEKVSTDLEALNAERDRPSIVAERRGCGTDKRREGVVLRPLIELTKNNGARIIAKHKRDEFKETATAREISPEKLVVLSEARAIAAEWATEMRLTHVLDKLEPKAQDTKDIPRIIAAMLADIEREAAGEIAPSREANKEIGAATAKMWKKRCQQRLEVS